jgi:PPOX class probable F420-dependent enzyme
VRLTEEESLRLLGASSSAVLAVNDRAGPPLAVPITFAITGDGHEETLVFAVDHKPKASRRLRRLRLIEADPRVAVLADGYDDDWRRLWWVRVDGTAVILPAAAAGAPGEERERAVRALTDRYPQYAGHEPRGELVAIRIEAITGWSGADLAAD